MARVYYFFTTLTLSLSLIVLTFRLKLHLLCVSNNRPFSNDDDANLGGVV